MSVKWLFVGYTAFCVIDTLVPEFSIEIHKSDYVGLATLSLMYLLYKWSSKEV